MNDLNSYKRDLLQKDQEIADMRKSLEDYANRCDDLQNELDDKTMEM